MSITVGVNSWVTLAAANIYFQSKYGAGGWTSLSDTEKEQLLISAFRLIRADKYLSVPATATAQIVKDAQCEMAWFIYEYNEEYKKRKALYASGVRNFGISKFSETLAEPELPIDVVNLLQDYSTKGVFFPQFKRDLET